MEAITGLSPKVSIKTIVIPLVDRVSAYASRRREEKGKGSPTPSNEDSGDEDEGKDTDDLPKAKVREASQLQSVKGAGEEDSEQLPPPVQEDTLLADQEERAESRSRSASDAEASLEEAAAGHDSGVQEAAQILASTRLDDGDGGNDDVPGSVKRNEVDTLASLFSSFWSHVSGLIESRPDLPLHDAIAICASMLRLSLACNPQPAEPVDDVLAFVREQLRARDLSPGAHNPATANQLLSLLLGPLRAYPNPLKVLELGNYGPLLESQAERTRKSVAVALLTAILQRNTTMATEEEVAGIVRLCASLMSRAPEAQSAALGHTSASDMPYPGTPFDEDDLAEEQGLLARLVHLIRGPDVVSQLSLLTVARDAFSQGGDLVRYTYPAVVAGATRLLGPFAAMKPEESGAARSEWIKRVRQLCRFIQATISVLVERSSGSPLVAELALQLYLASAQAASMSPAFRDEPALEEAAYEFIVQAFTIYEEHINESRAQYQALMLVINALHASRNFSAENYETLVAKCVQHGSRLLKRPDQTRVAYACAQLWWKTLPDSELIPPPLEAGQDEAQVEHAHAERVEHERTAIEQHNNGDKVLAHLQRSLKVADSCLDPVLSVRLFVELLNQSTMHYERRCLA
ncbi:retromer complex subunit Vps35, partial [Coemansia sp. S100]